MDKAIILDVTGSMHHEPYIKLIESMNLESPIIIYIMNNDGIRPLTAHIQKSLRNNFFNCTDPDVDVMETSYLHWKLNHVKNVIYLGDDRHESDLRNWFYRRSNLRLWNVESFSTEEVKPLLEKALGIGDVSKLFEGDAREDLIDLLQEVLRVFKQVHTNWTPSRKDAARHINAEVELLERIDNVVRKYR
jgi:hypothetical protein